MYDLIILILGNISHYCYYTH